MGTKGEVTEYLIRLKRGEKCIDEFVKSAVGYVGYAVYRSLADKSYLQEAIDSAFFHAIKYLDRFDETGNGVGWLCKIAQNEAYKINSRTAVARADCEVSIDGPDASDISVSDVSDKYLALSDLYKALDRLDETDRLVIEYIYFEGYTYEEIAEKLGMSVGNVHYKKKTALKKLLKWLSD